MFRDLSIRSKILFVTIVPVIALLFVSVDAYRQLLLVKHETRLFAQQSLPQAAGNLRDKIFVDRGAATTITPEQYDKYVSLFSQSFRDIQDLEESSLMNILWFSGLTIFIALLINIILSRRIVSSLKTATMIAKEICRGNRQVEISVQSNDETGQLLAILKQMLQSINDVEDKLKDNEHQLRVITDASPVLISYVDHRGIYRFCNRVYEKWVGVHREDIIGQHTSKIWGEKNTTAIKQNRMKALKGNDVEFDYVFNHSGKRRFASIHYIPNVKHNIVEGYFEIIADVTTLKIIQERFQLAIAGSDNGLWDWDITTDEVYYTTRYKQLLGYEDDEFANHKHTFYEHLHPHDKDNILRALQRHLQQHEPYDFDFRLRTKEGSYRWFHSKAQAIWNTEGQPVRMAGSISDITERKNAEMQIIENRKELERLSRTDALTGLDNRRYLLEQINREILRSNRYGSALSILMVDIDHFKPINDNHGHRAGDIILQYFANLLRDSVRVTDIVGRYGGEEFSLVLPETDISIAEKIADRIRADTANYHFQIADDLQLSITCSIGAAQYHTQIITAEEFLHFADGALYQAKELGRNRVIIASN